MDANECFTQLAGYARAGTTKASIFSVFSYLWQVAKNLVKKSPAGPVFDIRLGDCEAGMHQLPSSSVDVVVTSPPYNLGKEYSAYDDNKTPEEYLDWCELWAGQIARILKPEGS